MRREEIPTYFYTIISLTSQSRLKASLVRPPETMLSEDEDAPSMVRAELLAAD